MEDDFLGEEREAHEFDAKDVAAPDNASEGEFAFSVADGGVFFPSQRVRSGYGGAGEKGFSAAGRAGDFVGRQWSALCFGLRWAWGGGAWLFLGGRGGLRGQGEGGFV